MKNNLLPAQYSSSNPISRGLKARYQWLITTPQRALEQAYTEPSKTIRNYRLKPGRVKL